MHREQSQRTELQQLAIIFSTFDEELFPWKTPSY